MIKLTHIEKIYAKGTKREVKALKDVSLTINEGEIFGVIGLSGAGKSTLIRNINLLERPTSGTVEVDGKDLTAMKQAQLRVERRKIGMIFQSFNLLSSLTVAKNVAFPLELEGRLDKEAIDKRVAHLLELVGLSDKADMYPAQLSGGQKQRVGIARALAAEPKVLLCDEATSALDPKTTSSILELLLDLRDKLKLTIVIITHQMEVARTLFDKIAVMDSGKIIEQGLCYDVFASPQHEITKSLVSSSWHLELPPEVFIHEKELFVITYSGNNAYEPLISKVSRDFEVQVPIVGGKIEYISGKPLGILVIGIHGSEEKRTAAINFIKTQARLDRLTYKEN